MARVKNARGIIWRKIKYWHLAQKNDSPSFKDKKKTYKMTFTAKEVSALIQVMQDFDQLQRVLDMAKKESTGTEDNG